MLSQQSEDRQELEKMGATNQEGATDLSFSQKVNRSYILLKINMFLLKHYRETLNMDDSVAAETIHFYVNKSEDIQENISFITVSRMVKNVFKSVQYEKESKTFYGLERIEATDEEDVLSCRNIKTTKTGWSLALLNNLAKMYYSQILCDAFLMCRDGTEESRIPAHSCLLAAMSPVLQYHLSDHLRKDSSGHAMGISCPNINAKEWLILLQFMYHGTIDMPIDFVKRIWTLARFLRISGLVVFLEELMAQNDIVINDKMSYKNVDQGQIVVQRVVYKATDFTRNGTTLDNNDLFDTHDCNSQSDNSDISSDINISIRCNTPDSITIKQEKTSDIQQSEGFEPKAKRRKMYVPRKIATETDIRSQPSPSDLQLHSSRGVNNTSVLNLTTDVSQTEDICIGTVTLKSEVENTDCESETSEPDYSQSLSDSITNVSSDQTSNQKSHTYEKSAIDGNFDIPESTELTAETADKAYEGSSAFNCSQDGREQIKDAPDLSHGELSDVCYLPEYMPEPLVIAPLESDSSQHADEQVPSESSSLLYDLLKTSQKQQESSKPMFQSLLTKVTATDFSSDGDKSSIRDILERETEVDSNPDPEYRTHNRRKSSRHIRSSQSSKRSALLEALTSSTPMSHHRRLKDSHNSTNRNCDTIVDTLKTTEDFSASNLLLSVIKKASPKAGGASSEHKSKNVECEAVGSTSTSMHTHDIEKTQTSDETLEIVPNAESHTPASQILMSLLAEKSKREKASQIATEKPTALATTSKPPRRHDSPSGQVTSENSGHPISFSDVLQGMASAYHEPKANSSLNSSEHSSLLQALTGTNSSHNLRRLLTGSSSDQTKVDKVPLLEHLLSTSNAKETPKRAGKASKGAANDTPKSGVNSMLRQYLKRRLERQGDETKAESICLDTPDWEQYINLILKHGKQS